MLPHKDISISPPLVYTRYKRGVMTLVMMLYYWMGLPLPLQGFLSFSGETLIFGASILSGERKG